MLELWPQITPWNVFDLPYDQFRILAWTVDERARQAKKESG